MTETDAAEALTAVLDGVAEELRSTRATYTPGLLTSIHALIRAASGLASKLDEERQR